MAVFLLDERLIPGGINPAVIALDGELYGAQTKLTLARAVTQHSVHYGLGVFEGDRAYPAADGKGLFLLASMEHNKRLLRSTHHQKFSPELPSTTELEIIARNEGTTLEAIEGEFEPPLDTIKIFRADYNRNLEDLTATKIAVLKEEIRQGRINPQDGVYIRTVVNKSHPEGAIAGGVFSAYHHALEIMLAWTWGKYLGKDGFEKGVPVRIDEERKSPTNKDAKNKLVSNYATNQQGKNRAKANRFNEALYLDTEGNILEGSGENILLELKNGKLITPNRENQPILNGITMQIVEQIARNLGYEIDNTQKIPYDCLFTDVAGAIFTGTACEVTPINRIFDPKTKRSVKYEVTPTLRRIQREYMNLVTGGQVDPRNKDLQDMMLTYVPLN